MVPSSYAARFNEQWRRSGNSGSSRPTQRLKRIFCSNKLIDKIQVNVSLYLNAVTLTQVVEKQLSAARTLSARPHRISTRSTQARCLSGASSLLNLQVVIKPNYSLTEFTATDFTLLQDDTKKENFWKTQQKLKKSKKKKFNLCVSMHHYVWVY